MADSPTQQADPKGKDIGRLFLHDVNRETLSGKKTLSNTAVQAQSLDPNGSGRTVVLPAEEEGLLFLIANRASAANALTVKEDSESTTLVTVSQNQASLLYSDGTGWYVIGGSAASAQT